MIKVELTASGSIVLAMPALAIRLPKVGWFIPDKLSIVIPDRIISDRLVCPL
jgi:hypothetical protein